MMPMRWRSIETSSIGKWCTLGVGGLWIKVSEVKVDQFYDRGWSLDHFVISKVKVAMMMIHAHHDDGQWPSVIVFMMVSKMMMMVMLMRKSQGGNDEDPPHFPPWWCRSQFRKPQISIPKSTNHFVISGPPSREQESRWLSGPTSQQRDPSRSVTGSKQEQTNLGLNTDPTLSSRSSSGPSGILRFGKKKTFFGDLL